MTIDIQKAIIFACVACILAATPIHARDYTAAVLKTGFPGENAGLVAAMADEMKAAGYRVMELDPAGLCDPAVLSADKVDVLVLPDSSALPAKSTDTIQAYLRAGGDIIALNTPMWQKSLVHIGNRWLTREEWQQENAKALPDHVLIDFGQSDLSGWMRGSNTMEVQTKAEVIPEGPAPGQKSLHVVIPNLTSYDTFACSKIDKPFSDGGTLTIFSAKGGPDTTQLLVEWAEKDGSRWMAVVALTQEWRRYVLRPENFQYWQSTPTRGFRGDQFKPENAESMSVGLAFSHTTGIPSGRHEYWVGPFGTGKMTPEYQEVLNATNPPALDTLSPTYKLFDMHGVVELSVRGDQAIVADDKLTVPSLLRSPQPRPRGGGFNKGRDWRFIPLIEGRAEGGEWRGTPATLTIQAAGPYKGGVWASFGIGDVEWYQTPAARKIIRQVAERMKNPVWLVDGGTNYYSYLADQRITMGAQTVFLHGEANHPHNARVTLTDPKTGKVAASNDWGIAPGKSSKSTVSKSWTPDAWPDGGFLATAELIDNGKVIDKVTHDVNVWKPKPAKHFVTSKNGDFYLDGKRWRAHGVNYMPSSGIGTEEGEYFEHYLSARAYDPEVFQRDVDHLKDLGFNAVSIFIYTGVEKDQNLLDLLRRLDLAGIKADLALRPGTPLDFLWPTIGDIIKNSRLMDNDTIFAYDLAWEPMFGHQRERVRWDGEWEKWIIEQYGSVLKAERDWGFPVPRDDKGKLTNPTPEQVDANGAWAGMTAAYRRFLDTLLYKKYGQARNLILSVDPNHMVSFRMAEATNPTYRWEGRIPYDFPYLAGAVDILSPEAYGRIGDWEAVKPGWFQFEWGRLYAPQRPFMWKEMGCSTWDLSRMRNSLSRQDFQAMFYTNFYKMLTATGTDGIFFWWYPGGFRYGENSDYGIINPDGTDRAVTKVIRELGPKFLNGPSTKPVNHWITVDRDAHPDGISGVYDKVKDEFWKAVDEGQTPGLRTDGTHADSGNCPMVAVGNTPCNGTNPPKYLDAMVDAVEVLDSSGKWVSVAKGGSVRIDVRKTVRARVWITNVGEAALLSPLPSDRTGAVRIDARGRLGVFETLLPADLGHLKSATVADVLLAPMGIIAPTTVTISFSATKRGAFGEKFSLTLMPGI